MIKFNIDAHVNYTKVELNFVSKFCIKLLKKMLKKNPKDRPSASELLQDEWFEVKEKHLKGKYNKINVSNKNFFR